jgi:acyl-CoA dehydrogenase
MHFTWILVTLAVIWGLAYHRAPLWLWSALAALGFGLVLHNGALAAGLQVALWSVFGVFALLLNVPLLRRQLITRPVFALFRRILPAMSDTEREALEAGTVWWEADLFNGAPRWEKLKAIPKAQLSAEEQAFLDGPCEELCRMLDDWDITHVRNDLPPKVWQFIKDNGFFGMIIPKKYGGLEFSALAHSAVVMKVSSRSITAGVTIMVPNSLGPAELLLHYGTDAQKNQYLPRLARGQDVPCFGLTAPDAGSDAASIPDRGIVCHGEFRGQKDVLGVRLNWEKRYITLGPVATVLGLAFPLYDPDRLLGGEESLGITLALIPTNTAGVKIGSRHNPLDISFQNGPNWGTDVFIPMDWIIGGREYIGQGWRMLMDCLAAGRSISLPATAAAAGQHAARHIGAYARIRKQFKTPIGKFEAIEEALSRIGGYAYLMEAARTLTARAVDLGEKPSVASAIVKYQLTEHMRRVVTDGMDIQGGAAICLGPRNFMGRVYQGTPIVITVEGANILTRSLIVYGQGAIRCHPYVLKEMRAVVNPDRAKGLADFDRAFFGHVGFVISNALRALWLGLGGVHFVRVPFTGTSARYARRLTRVSSGFAFISDMAMLLLGGTLKRKERISARFADVLSYMYLASASIKRFEDDGRPPEDLPLVRWSCDYALHQAEKTLVMIIKNLPNPFMRWLIGGLVFPAGRRYHVPSDHLGHEVAKILLEPSAARDRLTAGIFVSFDPQDVTGRLEDALPKVIVAEPLERKLYKLVDERRFLHGDFEGQLRVALERNIINPQEAEVLRSSQVARRSVITVDDFPPNHR